MSTNKQQQDKTKKVLALSGGVGGAKLALGLSCVLKANQLTVVANTGDDFDHLGLRICPDLDTLMYTLGRVSDQTQGWGLADESWQFHTAMSRLGGPSWFQLGDTDLATHVLRTDKLRQGQSLSAIMQQLCQKLEVTTKILPMTDDLVQTKVATTEGILDFQHYFVRERCSPAVTGFYFEGIEQARPQREFLDLLYSNKLSAIIICPSNPYVSVDPILNLANIREALIETSVPVVAISPIIGSNAVKGPTAKMMQELNISVSALEVAKHYSDVLDGFIIDELDKEQVDSIKEMGIEVITSSVMMNDLHDKKRLAKTALDFATKLRQQELCK